MVLDISPLWIVVGLVLFGLGIRWAVMRRASSDYQRTKAGLPGMRSTYWHTFWAMARAAGLVLVIVVALGWFDLRSHGVDTGDLLSRLRDARPGTSADDQSTESNWRDGADNGNVICFSAECRRQHPER
jgi:ABC-type Fe3+ transport system permease subunit